MPMDVNYLTALLLLSERGNASYSYSLVWHQAHP